MAGPIGSSQFMYNSSSASSFYDYQIEQSARFDDAGGGTNASSRLSRTFGTASSATKFTFSVWVKRSTTHANDQNTTWQNIISRGTGVQGGGSSFGFECGGGTSGGLTNNDRITWYGLKGTSGGTTGGDDRINGFFVDTNNWYHIVIRTDTTESDADDKLRYYINGDLRTRVSTNALNGDLDRFHATSDEHNIGSTSNGYYGFGGYMAEFIYADGQSYAPTQFGESKNGVWIPKDPTGTTFGNLGFHLKFENASDLGNDSSGNDNDWTVANMGTDHQVIDSPTIGTG